MRVAACGICGTDLSYIRMGGLRWYRADGPRPRDGRRGRRVGADVRDWRAGDRVIVYPGNDELGRMGNGISEGGLTPRLLVREVAGGGRLYRVPDGMPLSIAALAEPLGVGMQAVNQADGRTGRHGRGVRLRPGRACSRSPRWPTGGSSRSSRST